MGFKNIVHADQRRHILEVLEQDPGYSHNEHVIKRMLMAVGHKIGGGKVRAHLQFLEDQDLVEIDRDLEETWVVELTRLGEDVALGRTVIDGVARRGP